MPDDTKITYNNIAYWVPVPWYNHEGRATLAGDAAHPMPPRMLFHHIIFFPSLPSPSHQKSHPQLMRNIWYLD
jgi:hypothetical protein